MKRLLFATALLATLLTGCEPEREITDIEAPTAVWLPDNGELVIHGNGFKPGDSFRLTTGGTVTYDCGAIVLGNTAIITLADKMNTSTYEITLVTPKGKEYPAATTEITINDEARLARGPVKIVAHRGYHADVPENSLASLRASQLYGFYGSEFDIWITADNVVMVQHDGEFELDSTQYRIEDTDYETARKYTLANGEPLPTLDEYLAQGKKVPSVKMILEIKTHKDFERTKAAIDSTLALVDKYGMAEQMEYITFCYDACVYLHGLRPDAIVRYLDETSDDYKTPEEVAAAKLSGPYPMSGLLKETVDDIRKTHELGMTMAVWDVTPEELDFWIENKVDIVNTNFPKDFMEKFRREVMIEQGFIKREFNEE